MTDSVKQLTAPLMALPPKRRWAVAGVVVLSLLAFTLLITVANRIDYKPLFANLGSEDAGEIVKKLKEQKVSYRIAADGKAILVPAEKVYELRLALASEGLPQGGGVGFEIFDRKNFGMTEFVQKLNYQRALQGELARTIMQIAGVEHARVHLAIPEKSLFKDSDNPPTASVVLKMKSGRMLRESEVQGVVHLLASSVEGMDPEKVTVLDSRGKIMSHAGSSDSAGKLTSSMMETRRSYEKDLEERLQSLLDKAVGAGKSVARVNAVLDLKRVEKVEERYDPEASAVRSEQRREEKGATTSGASGIPGVQANTAKTVAAAPPVTGGASKKDETRNYEVSHSSARIFEPAGTLTKLSVAILVDGKYETGTATKSGRSAKPKYLPRNAEELQKIEALVRSSVGYNAERGDQLTVVNVPFQDTGEEGANDSPTWWEKPAVVGMGKNSMLALAFIALLLMIVRPLMKMIPSVGERQKGSFEALEQHREKAEQLEGGMANQFAQLGMMNKSQGELVSIVKQDPYQTSQILQNWLKERN